MSAWQDCIVTLIDLIGIKKHAHHGDLKATTLMRHFHALVLKRIRDLPSIDHAYAWNDSVLLLAYLGTERNKKEVVLREIDAFKREIDILADSYAIAVQGQNFPETPFLARGRRPRNTHERVTILRVSSYAMANCFAIEEKLGRSTQKPWYVDERIARQLSSQQKCETKPMVFLPHGAKRNVFIYEGYLWQ